MTQAIHAGRMKPSDQGNRFWLGFLIVLPLCAVTASIATLFIAIESSDQRVDDNYYKEGLGINKTLHALETAKRLNLSAQCDINYETRQLTIQLDGNTQHHPHSVLVKFEHPLEKSLDMALTAKPAAQSGLYVTPLPIEKIELAGRWYVSISGVSPENASESWKMTSEITLEAQTIQPTTHFIVSSHNENHD